jgi:glycosyltransferase involved in cell wall biosynthesis
LSQGNAARTGRVLVDIGGAQSVHRHRGIARFVLELALALEETCPGHVDAFLLNPDLAPPEAMEPLLASGKLRPSDEVAFEGGDVLHVTSPYEIGVPLHRILPGNARRGGVALVITLYDLIPEVMPHPYLQDPGYRQLWRARHHLARSAHAVLAISEATRRDAIERLQLDPARVTVVGAGVSPRFTPPQSREAAARAAAEAVPGVRDPFVLYIAGHDARKNVETLLQAWVELPEALRARFQLVVTLGPHPLTQNHYRLVADRLGIGDSVYFPDLVSEAGLLVLYQGADLFVFPSLYEGYGLPVAEALACGTPVVAAANSSLVELVRPPALFDPADAGAMAAVIARALTDEAMREELLGRAGRPPHTWAGVARRTAEAYDTVLAERAARRLPRRRAAGRAEAPHRPRVALASPLPPQACEAADYGYRLAEELSRHAEVHAFADGPFRPWTDRRPPRVPEGVDVHPVASLGRVEAVLGPFDAVFYCLGNSEFHTGALAALRRRPGVVLAHDVHLTDLYRLGPLHHPGAVPDGFFAALQAMYAGRIPEDLGSSGRLEPGEAERWGLLMVREVLALSERFLALSPSAAELARLDAAPADRDKVAVLPPTTETLLELLLGSPVRS